MKSSTWLSAGLALALAGCTVTLVDERARDIPAPDAGPCTMCGGSCVNLMSDPTHCGACDQPCVDGVCVSGVCQTCAATEITCGGTCVDPSSDPRHCGACDFACGAEDVCWDGECAPDPCEAEAGTFCGGECVDLMFDQDNCGACGNACPIDGECREGACECDGGPCEPSCAGAECPSFTSIVTADSRTCAIADDRSVWCWGNNGFGVLGDPSSIQETLSPIRIDGVRDVVQLALSGRHACALTITSEVQCWGSNSFGEIDGDLSGTIGFPPTMVAGATGAATVAAGAGYSCTLEGGYPYCWGSAEFMGSRADDPARLPDWNGIDALGIGFDGICLARDSIVDCYRATDDGWRSFFHEMIDEPLHLTTIAVGGAHACGLDAEGSVFCWGSGTYGQLGRGEVSSESGVLERVALAPSVAVAAGGAHSCAVTSAGEVHCWGANDDGQLGIGPTSGEPLPVRVSGLSDVVSIDAGHSYTCAVTEGGDAYCWGRNEGWLGVESTESIVWTPSQVTF